MSLCARGGSGSFIRLERTRASADGLTRLKGSVGRTRGVW
jgi:hypothetical protein